MHSSQKYLFKVSNRDTRIFGHCPTMLINDFEYCLSTSGTLQNFRNLCKTKKDATVFKRT